MKISDIISESTDLDEAPAGWLRQKARGLGARLGSKTAATTKATGDEANELKRELKAWMAGSQIAKGQLTVDDLETYLKQKGYGGLAKAELDQLRKSERAKAQAQAAKSAARSAKMQAVGYKAGQMAGAAGRAIKNASGVVPHGNVSEARRNPTTAPLTNAEIDKVLMAVVAKAYKTGSNFEKGRFAQPDKPAAPAPGAGQPVDLNTVDPKDVKLITALKAKGYTVTK